MSSGYDSAKTADEIRDGNVEALIEGVLTDNKPVANALLAAEQADLPEDAPLREILERAETTHMLRSARKNGHVSSMNAATGLSETRSEATGYDRLINALRPAAQQAVFRGQKGTGKTGTALELIRWLFREDVVEKVMMNVPVRGMSREDLERAGEISNIPDWWLDEDENDALGTLAPHVRFECDISGFLEFAREPGEKLALFDEFSSSGNAYTNQGDVESIMSKCINAFRKSPNGSLRTIYVGHKNDSDIHPLVRKQSDVIISKDGKADEGMADLATIYDHWEKYLKGNQWFKVRGVRDVPGESPWRYETNYFAHLEWDLDDPENQIDHGKLIEDWEQYQDDDGEGDAASGETRQQAVQCRGTNTDGDQCGNQYVTHESGFCGTHRAQWGGDPDPRTTDDAGGETTREARDTPDTGTSGNTRDDARDAAQGAQDALSALQAATGEHDADEDDRALIAAALQSEHPDDLTDEEAERMADSLTRQSGGSDGGE
ncbi:hypothetical protein HLRTI_001308 [Halorhabdus tiamatea SARL4B]|uniref:Uncharacterized protein n=1 Tax=Halorhabdus tiamatea SARL4B TaxID=1033806 RepID=F7PI10_9EURY|nr:hypothetical protein [Halorhabdus tiamatea]ERJ06602.1 hypothetical protein HLRTI_001308 [Halorhabdus tiamatea SARL4B]CCQ32234.1 conserved hypothetical protein [Halorhabdus tiamatea SARL4B]